MLRFQPEEMLRTLEQQHVRHVVIGGVGATLHGSPLPTRDAEDIIRSMEAANSEKDRQALPTLRLLLAKRRSEPPKPT